MSASCARVQSHFALPELAAEEPSFLPTVEAYTSAAHGGNTASLLLNGDQIFPAQLDAIRSARETISYAQYFYEEGSIGREIAEALAERCRAGIRAHILLDGFGTVLIPTAYQETMRQAGCKVATFRPLSPLSLLAAVGLRRDNKRNHRRILVVDGRIGFTGGSGISPKWMGDGRTEGQWRDTDVRMEGPIVASLQGAFVENWLEATGDVLGGDAYFPPVPRRGSLSAQIVRSSPAGGSFSMYTMFLLAMSSARRSIYITNPYFLPDDRMTRVLREAPGRGVRVVVLLPGTIDNNMVRQASRSTFGKLLRAGIEIYEYQPGLLHAKTMTIDGIWATIGSTNLDTRSFALNEELNAVMYGKDVAGQLDQHFADDLRYSRKVDYRRRRSRGFFPRLLEVLSLPVREQL
ncbi:MAG TPA: phospholipase D-like domain-containing protein [Methylomirabilota bacterium]|nr:phospholipase D-like domain-containing protein [Methylomirabilota bacterium]